MRFTSSDINLCVFYTQIKPQMPGECRAPTCNKTYDMCLQCLVRLVVVSVKRLPSIKLLLMDGGGLGPCEKQTCARLTCKTAFQFLRPFCSRILKYIFTHTTVKMTTGFVFCGRIDSIIPLLLWSLVLIFVIYLNPIYTATSTKSHWKRSLGTFLYRDYCSRDI